ncbi:MAG TPA: hypothetical protein VIX17_17150 [Pyrinomonadaceae bacterium]
MVYLLLLIFISVIVAFCIRRRGAFQRQKKLTRAQENANLVKVLLELDTDSREELFQLYQDQFGENAARYARNTYQKWKAGSVRPNKQTFSRFLINLPRVMSFDLKCEVLRELREAYCPRGDYNVTVSVDNWKSSLTPLVEEIIQRATSAELPESLQRRLTWLAQDDILAANALLAESQARESRNAMALLEKEFSNIDELLDNAPRNTRISHVLKLPLGSITVQIKR